MSGMEHILPKEHQFNTSLAEVREMLVDIIADAKADLGDIISPSAEFSRRN